MIDMQLGNYTYYFVFMWNNLFCQPLLWNRYRTSGRNYSSDGEWVKFGQAYFFSAQTFTTVGYGHISSFLTSSLSSEEALIGLLSFKCSRFVLRKIQQTYRIF
jgi:hypothetical protein